MNTEKFQKSVVILVSVLGITVCLYLGFLRPVVQNNTACDQIQKQLAARGDSVELTGFQTQWSGLESKPQKIYVKHKRHVTWQHTCNVYNDTEAFVEYRADTVLRDPGSVTRINTTNITQWLKVDNTWRTLN